jgi:hypothetical protein
MQAELLTTPNKKQRLVSEECPALPPEILNLIVQACDDESLVILKNLRPLKEFSLKELDSRVTLPASKC